VTARPAAAAALLLVAHGVRGGPGIAVTHAAALRKTGLFDDVAAACLKGEPSVAAALQSLSARRVVALPLLMADGYSYGRLLPEQLLLAQTAKEVRLCRPLGLLPGMAGIATDLAFGSCADRGWNAGDAAVIIAAHGTARSASSRCTALKLAAHLRARDIFRDVEAAFLDDKPPLPETLRRLRRQPAVVLGFFADSGVHGEVDLARLVAESGCSEIIYAGPIGRTDGVRDLIAAEARVAMAGGARREAAVEATN
jgi:sirohydrochlorin ferrochelatase